MKKILSTLLALCMVLTLLPIAGITSFAATSGDFEYRVLSEEEKTCEITGYTGAATELNIPSGIDGYTVMSIGDSAFDYCSSLINVTIPDSITSIGRYAFYVCKSLSNITIPNGVTSIEEGAFNCCSSLTSIIIPDSVTSIDGVMGTNGYYLFAGCSSLTSINVSEGNPNYSSEDGVLFNKDKTEILQYPAGKTDKTYTIPDGVVNITNSTFSSCAFLTSVIIPNGVISIGSEAFEFCDSLTSVIIPDSVMHIGSEAFRFTPLYYNTDNWCNDVLYIGKHLIEARDGLSGAYIIKNGTLTIADSAFDDCTALTSVTITDRVVSIGKSAFRFCSSLTSVSIPSGVVSIGEYAFCECTALSSVTIPNSVTSIENSAFFKCTSLESITIPNSVTSIGSCAFYNCTSLADIIIADNVKYIGDGAFADTAYYNTAENWKDGALYIGVYLIKVNSNTVGSKYTVKPGLKIIANDAFRDCWSLKIIIGDYECEPAHFSDMIEGQATSWEAFSITNYTGTAADLTIPEQLFGYDIWDIEDYAFRNCKNLKSVDVSHVSYFGMGVFEGCENLTDVTLSTTLRYIERAMFRDCSSLINITIPDSVTDIYYDAFENCTSLKDITVPDNVKFIGPDAFTNTAYYNDAANWENDVLYMNGHLIEAKDTIAGEYTIKPGTKTIVSSAFEDCAALTNITMPNSITYIGFSAFLGCTNLVSIALPDSITAIENRLFFECEKLKSITIPDSVTAIGENAFYACSSLANIAIPDGLERIGSSAFEKCTSLVSITIPNRVVVNEWNDDMLKGCVSLENIFVGENNTSCTSVNGVLFNKDKTKLIQYPGAKSDLSYTIPNSVIEIAPDAFEYCSNLIEISVSPENTSYCSADGVLFNKEKTNLLRYPSAKADKSYVIPDSVTDIAETAFFDCEKLECLTVSENVKRITSPNYNGSYVEGGAFRNNASLKKVVWNAEKCYIAHADKYTDPESPEYNPNVVIPNAFSFFPNCTELVVGDTVKYIPCTILANNQKIESVTISDSVIRIQPCAFYNCKNLKSVTIGNSVANIGFCAFEDCTSLSDVTIGNSVTGIGYATFRNCTGITEITIPNSVKSIDDSAFDKCWDLGDVYYSGAQEEWEKISIGESNYSLTSAHIHYNTTENHYEFVEIVNATCTEDGYNKYICLCGYEKREVIPALGHIGEIVETVPPTCTSDGYTKHICSVCGEEYKTDWVWAEGHTKGEIVEVVPPTCTSEGYTKYRCSVCGEEFESDWTDLEEHSYELFESRTATCTETGCDVYKCINCDDIKYVSTTEALGHSFENDICINCGMLKSDCLESNHNYANNEDKTWILTKSGAQSVAVTFSRDTFVERGWDYIYIYEGNDVLIGKYTGDELAGKRIVVLGDTVKIRLTSDSSGTRFGFMLSKVETNISQTIESGGVIVTEGKIGDFSSDTRLKVETLEAEDGQIKYDISLMQGENIVQPTVPVTVKIPVPDTIDGTQCKVYRQEADGTYTNMNAVYQDGYMVFKTDHFSVYVLTADNPNVLLGDTNADGVIDDWDSVLLDRYLAGWDVEINTSATDMDENGVVDDWDGVLLARKLAGWN